MKISVAVGLIVLLGLARNAFAEDDHVALVRNVTGTMTIVHDGAPVAAAAGSTLSIADRIVSGPDSSAGIVFKDGTLLTVGSSTEVDVRAYVFEPKTATYAFSAYLAKGTAIYSSGKIGKLSPESVRIDTPTATVGVRGTRFIISAE